MFIFSYTAIPLFRDLREECGQTAMPPISLQPGYGEPGQPPVRTHPGSQPCPLHQLVSTGTGVSQRGVWRQLRAREMRDDAAPAPTQACVAPLKRVHPQGLKERSPEGSRSQPDAGRCGKAADHGANAWGGTRAWPGRSAPETPPQAKWAPAASVAGRCCPPVAARWEPGRRPGGGWQGRWEGPRATGRTGRRRVFKALAGRDCAVRPELPGSPATRAQRSNCNGRHDLSHNPGPHLPWASHGLPCPAALCPAPWELKA